MKLSYKFYLGIGYAKVPSLDWQHTYQLFWGRRGGRGEGGREYDRFPLGDSSHHKNGEIESPHRSYIGL